VTHAEQGFWRRYVFSTDHKTIGKQYLLTAFVMALFGISWSILMRMQIAWPDASWPFLGQLLPGLRASTRAGCCCPSAISASSPCTER
jgi:hypothetical protein